MRHIPELKDVQFVQLTGEDFNGIKRSIKENELSAYKYMIIGRDTADYFAKTFKAERSLYTAFDGENKKRRCVYVGRMKIEQLVATAI